MQKQTKGVIKFVAQEHKTDHLLIELHDLGSSLGNAVLVTGNSDLILVEGGRGDIDTSSC